MKNFKYPSFIGEGDKIGIISTARKISSNELKPAIQILQNEGFEVVLGDNIFEQEAQYAGNDLQRAKDFQRMLDDPQIKAILFARGGYGTIRIMDKVCFDTFKKNPKWLIGYSDVTVIHSYINRHYDYATMHATMPLNFPAEGYKNCAIQTLIDAMKGKNIEYQFEAHPLNRPGIAEAEVVGGNLSILYSLTGTDLIMKTQGKILFIEDLDEYLYHIDRMMMNLKKAGVLDNLAGLLIGGMSDMNDNTVPFGKNAEEIIAEHVKEYSYPVCFNFPAGHITDNRAIILGGTAIIESVKSGNSIFKQYLSK